MKFPSRRFLISTLVVVIVASVSAMFTPSVSGQLGTGGTGGTGPVPTSAPTPETPTAVPPTATTVPATATSVPPTATATSTATPTALPPTPTPTAVPDPWTPVVMVWNPETGFVIFEDVDTGKAIFDLWAGNMQAIADQIVDEARMSVAAEAGTLQTEQEALRVMFADLERLIGVVRDVGFSQQQLGIMLLSLQGRLEAAIASIPTEWPTPVATVAVTVVPAAAVTAGPTAAAGQVVIEICNQCDLR